MSTSLGWKAKYTIRFIDSGNPLCNLEFDLPNEDISSILERNRNSRVPSRLQFPVAISKTLRRVVVVRSMLTIDKKDLAIHIDAIHAQVPKVIIQRLKLDSPTIGLSEPDYQERAYFSDSDDAVAVVTGSFDKQAIQKRIIELWSCHNSEFIYSYRGQVKACVTCYKYVEKGPLFLFHPSLESILFRQFTTLRLWFYNRSNVCFAYRNELVLYNRPSDRLQRQRYTKNVYGTSRVRDHVKLEDFLFPNFKLAGSPEFAGLRSKVVPSKFATPRKTISREQLRTQSLDKATIDSTLSTTPSFMSLGPEMGLAHGTSDAQPVLFPKVHSNEQTSVDILPSIEGQEYITLIWNKEEQDTYNLHDAQSRHLPSIIKRRLDSKVKSTIEATEEDTAKATSASQQSGVPTKIRLINNK
ncbi:hypothetical protein F4820DRAFT_76315 [Hypoxylon rubiginosum]|uniref:Uncharacterized protein n=1 Tax=Hypoxylon rubiginosum TaxID=110542 RepID=A0ACB9ZBA1_9PEZI|nr:hypothetical protein F4820DRAFT_76315 [Hypoxylon rubiginosum]